MNVLKYCVFLVCDVNFDGWGPFGAEVRWGDGLKVVRLQGESLKELMRQGFVVASLV